ncbi:MAG: type VI secretion system tube protein TssD [Pseudomonadota bacterium]
MFRTLTALTVSIMIMSASASAQPQIYIPPFVSDNSGEIKGPVMLSGLEEHIEVIGFEHEISSSADMASGLPTGKRQHKPLTIVKELDEASPLLADTMTRNGGIDEIEFRFYRPSSQGARQHYFTITLNDAQISGIRHEMGPGALSPLYEYISFTYAKIIWEHETEGTTAMATSQPTRRRM